MSDTKQTRSETYKKIAYGLAIFGVIVLSITFAIYRSQFTGDYSPSGSDWGIFGDYIGGIAGTLLAFATLIALVVALVVQATELEETRQALQEQVTATQQQLKDVRRYEDRRLQPLLKSEWYQYGPDDNFLSWRVTNIGLGPCIMDEVHVYVDDELIGSHDFQSRTKAEGVWFDAISKVSHPVPIGQMDIEIGAMNDFRRMLASPEFQSILSINCDSGQNAGFLVKQLESRIRPVIFFRSLAKEKMSTDTQYEALFDAGTEAEGTQSTTPESV